MPLHEWKEIVLAYDAIVRVFIMIGYSLCQLVDFCTLRMLIVLEQSSFRRREFVELAKSVPICARS